MRRPAWRLSILRSGRLAAECFAAGGSHYCRSRPGMIPEIDSMLCRPSPSPTLAIQPVIAVLVLLLSLVVIAPALAQVPTIPAAARSSTDPTRVSQDILPFVRAQFERMSGEDKMQTATARQELIDAMGGSSNTGTFIDEMIRRITTQLPAIQNRQNVPLHVRLNLAILIARAAETGNKVSVPSVLSLEPAVIKLLDDPNEGVVLWGLKAAQQVLPAILADRNQGPGTNLPQKINEAARRFPASSAIAVETLDAIRSVNGPALPARKNQMVDAMHNFLEPRLAAGQDGGVPVEPSLDVGVLSYLMNANNWQVQSAEQKDKTVEQITQLMILANAKLKTIRVGKDRENYSNIVRYGGSGFGVVGKLQNNAKLIAGSEKASMLRTSSSDAEFDAAMADLMPALKEAFPKAKLP